MSETCSVCGSEVNNRYCSNCGQEINHKDVTLVSLIGDLISNLFDLQRSAIAGVRMSFTQPRKLIHNYWNGNRRYYPSPGKMLFFALAIAAVHLAYVNRQVVGADISVDHVESQVVFWIILLPILSFCSLASFVRSKMSYAKHLVSTIYLGSAFYIAITVVNDILILTVGDILGATVLILFLQLVFVYNSIVMQADRGIGRIILGILLQNVMLVVVLAAISLLVYALIPTAVVMD